MKKYYFLGIIIIALISMFSVCNKEAPVSTESLPETTEAAIKTYVPPGELDEYYMFASGGHSGQVFVVGVPSMRLIRVLPVFSMDSAFGYGFDEHSKKMMTSKMPWGDEFFKWGDVHHPAPSETDGDYDGRWIFVNDMANARVARINLKTFFTEEIIQVPNVSGMHSACFVSPNTEYVFVGSRFPAPIPIGRYVPLDKYKEEYRSMQGAIKVDPKTGKMEVAWEIELPPLCMDKSDSGKLVSNGWVFYSSYNTELASRDLEVEASQNDRDFIIAVNWKAAEKAAEDSKNYKIIDGVKVMNPNDVPGLVYFIPCPKSPHGIDVTPDGKYLIGNGKLSPVVAVFDFELFLKAIENKNYEEEEWKGWKIPVVKYEAVNVAEVPVGLGPLHTQFDNEGYAYTSLFVESAVAKWKLGTWEVVDKIQVHYNVGHLTATHGDTVNPQGKYLVALNKLSKDHFLNVGPSHPENHQLIGIDGQKMKLLYDGPSQPEPHYAVMISRELIETKSKPIKIFPKDPNVPNSTWSIEDTKIEKKEDGTHVYMVVVRSRIVPDLVEVEEGETVFFHVTNIEDDPDITHGFGFLFLNTDMQVEPGETKTLKIEAVHRGVWPFYCTNFCSALHQEMTGYLLVKPKE